MVVVCLLDDFKCVIGKELLKLGYCEIKKFVPYGNESMLDFDIDGKHNSVTDDAYEFSIKSDVAIKVNIGDNMEYGIIKPFGTQNNIVECNTIDIKAICKEFGSKQVVVFCGSHEVFNVVSESMSDIGIKCIEHSGDSSNDIKNIISACSELK